MAIPVDSRTVSATLSFNGNGGTGVPPDRSASAIANQAMGYSLYVNTTSVIPTRTGYDFLGWSHNSSATTADIGSGSAYAFYFPPSTSDQSQYANLYAVWRKKTYSVSFNANGGTGAPAAQTKTYGVALTLSSVVPTRSQYVFDGWSTTQGGQVEYQPGDSYTANTAVTLYAVWHLAGATLNSVTSPVEIGSTGTATWTNFSTTATYKLELTCGTAPTVTVIKGAGVTSATFTIPNTWLAALSGSTSGTATATLTTYEGDEALGSSTMSFTVTVPSGVKPTIDSFTVVPYSTNAKVMSWGEFVQGFAKADLEVSATPGTGATITAITFGGPGVNQTGTGTTARSEILNTPGTATFAVTVIDSRGRSATDTVSVTVYPYAAPVVTNIATMRADADGTTNNSRGDYLKVQPVYSLSSVNGNNSFTVQTLKYFEHGSSTPLASISCVSGTTYGPPGNMWAINLADAYDIVVELTDALGSSVGGTVVLPGAGGIWYGRGNDRLGLGKAPPSAGLHVDWKSFFYDDVTFYGNVSGVPAPTGFVPEAGADGFLVRSSNSVGTKEFMRSLWNDANGWNSGSKTIPGLSDYSIFAVRMDDANSMAIGMLGIKTLNTDPTHLRCVGGYGGASNYGWFYASFTRSGDTLTFESAYYVNNAGQKSAQKVIEIIGII